MTKSFGSVMKKSTFVDEKLLHKVSRAARLELSSEEFKSLIKECSEILEAFTLLNEVDVDGIAPSFHPISLPTTLREDVVGTCLAQTDALSNVKQSKDGYIRGPKVR